MPAPSRPWLLLLAALAAAALLLAAGPIPQPENYHAFVDTRAWLGLPNGADVLSNLPFLLVGLAGLWRLRGASPALPAWRLFFLAVALTAFGSAWYHLAPDNTRLVWDRLPIALACAALSCAVLAERVHSGFARLGLILASPLALLSVWHWSWTVARGAEDLRAYLYVQFLPMLIVLLILALYPLPSGERRRWGGMLGLYALAKAAELSDGPIYAFTGFVSGHSLKHLLAGWAAWQVAALLRGRRQAADCWRSE
ncbi:MAG: alkaline phytoceramidase [Gammaproteobacteria bacterium]|nr:alkaline phytoceramidase [Gammaproteobacteria bacterium]